MFPNIIYDLPLCGKTAEEMFPGFKAERYSDDASFQATLIALLNERVESAGVCVRTATDYARVTSEDFGNRENNIIMIVKGFDAQALREEVDPAVYKDTNYKENKVLYKFLNQNGLDVRIYSDESVHAVTILVANMTMRIYHMIQSLIPKYMPWAFKEKPMTTEDIELLRSLTFRTADEYKNRIIDYAKRFDFRVPFIKVNLKGVETEADKQQLNAVKAEIQRIYAQIEDLQNKYVSLYGQINTKETVRIGLEEKIRSGDGGSALMDYFIANKDIHLVSYQDGIIRFIISTYIQNYNQDVFDRSIDNPKSFWYRDNYDNYGAKYDNKKMSDERIKKLFMAIFGEEPILKLKTAACFEINIRTGHFKSIGNYGFPVEFKDCVPNQHVWHYNCFGANEPMIQNAMLAHDYVGAVLGCQTVAKNMNMTESNTGTMFMQFILGAHPGRYIEMPDGSCMTPLNAVKWLEAQETNSEFIEEENDDE